MAGKGGAWKVAYADFVTAMMAFFLVMWLISQDQKVRESIARYFMDPVGVRIFDAATTPANSGGLLEAEMAGSVPGSRLRSAGRGLGDTQESIEPDNETQIVNEWLFEDSAWVRRWRSLAVEELRRSQELLPAEPSKSATRAADEHARRQLAIRLQRLILEEGEAQTTGLSQDLFVRAVSRVEWERVAEECLWEVQDGEGSAAVPANGGMLPAGPVRSPE